MKIKFKCDSCKFSASLIKATEGPLKVCPMCSAEQGKKKSKPKKKKKSKKKV